MVLQLIEWTTRLQVTELLASTLWLTERFFCSAEVIGYTSVISLGSPYPTVTAWLYAMQSFLLSVDIVWNLHLLDWVMNYHHGHTFCHIQGMLSCGYWDLWLSDSDNRTYDISDLKDTIWYVFIYTYSILYLIEYVNMIGLRVSTDRGLSSRIQVTETSRL